MSKYQARWSLDTETVLYRGIEIQLNQITQLVVSEYQQAYSLLYDELLFGSQLVFLNHGS
jgi:hypothetical protein